jgi:hypothetical protein
MYHKKKEKPPKNLLSKLEIQEEMSDVLGFIPSCCKHEGIFNFAWQLCILCFWREKRDCKN